LARGIQNRQYLRNNEDRAKITINGLYKVVHWLSIAAKICDLELPLSEIQGHRFLKCRKKWRNRSLQISNDSDAIEWLEALSLSNLRIHAPVHLLTYLHA